MNLSNYRKAAITGLALLLLYVLPLNAIADEMELRRIMVGLKLFPAVIAADYLVTEKKDKEGHLLLFILHEDNAKQANDLANNLLQIQTIKNIPIKVEVHTFNDFLEQKLPSLAAAFIAEPANNQINKLINQGISSSTLLFSPFKGDVEKGIHSGFIVSDRILPHVNIATLNQSGIKLKPFFLRASKHYEQPER